jgi:hypothetical protein
MTANHALGSEVSPPGDNPFVTRAIRSGMVPFFFPPGESLRGLVERLRDHHWRGQIVGPHGSGKSTLLASLLPEIAEQAGEVAVARLFVGCRRLPSEFQSTGCFRRPAGGTRVFLIDGYEQLPPWRRGRLQRRCLHAGAGLLVSTHHALLGLPVLYQTQVTAETAWRVVTHLMPTQGAGLTRERVAALLASHAGDVRELLFELYDWYEEHGSRTDFQSVRNRAWTD